MLNCMRVERVANGWDFEDHGDKRQGGFMKQDLTVVAEADGVHESIQAFGVRGEGGGFELSGGGHAAENTDEIPEVESLATLTGEGNDVGRDTLSNLADETFPAFAGYACRVDFLSLAATANFRETATLWFAGGRGSG